MNLFLCKFIYFSCFLFSFFSSYLHVFISFERWYAISNPIRSKTNPLNNKKIFIIIFILGVLFSSPYIYFAQLKELLATNNNSAVYLKSSNFCEISQTSVISILILALNDYIICCIIPFLCALTFSSLTLLNLCKNKNTQVELSTKNNRKLSRNDSPGQNLELENNKFNSMKLIDNNSNREKIGMRKSTTLFSFRERKSSSFSSLRNFSRNSSRLSEMQRTNSISSSNFKLTIMLMSLPISFIITNFPIFIIIILQFYPFKGPNKDYRYESAIAKALMYLNNSIHILFYIFLGSTLRKDFKSLFKTIFKS